MKGRKGRAVRSVAFDSAVPKRAFRPSVGVIES
jgi:hypothetical protein